MKYHRIVLGKGNISRDIAKSKNYIGVDFDVEINLSDKSPEGLDTFLRIYFTEKNQELTNQQIGARVGTVGRFIFNTNIDDLVFINTGERSFNIFKITSDYFYSEINVFPHCKSVEFISTIPYENIPNRILNAFGAIGTLVELSNTEDILLMENVLRGNTNPNNVEQINLEHENDKSFYLEKELENFIIHNWSHISDFKGYTVLGDKDSDIYGKQYDTKKVGILDILAINTTEKKLLVIELKRKSGDAVVGQILRYISFIEEDFLTKDFYKKYVVLGLIVTDQLENRERTQIAYSIKKLPFIQHKSYKIKFELE